MIELVAWHPGVAAQQKASAEKSNMELVGYNDLQARSAYQPVIQRISVLIIQNAAFDFRQEFS